MMRGADTVGASDRRRRDVLSWIVEHPIEIAFALVVAAAAVWMYERNGSTWFGTDDWGLADEARQESHILEPFNGHLSITILIVYRVLLESFGFGTYVPFQVAGVGVTLAPAVGMFLLFRARAGAPLAAAAGLVLLWTRGVQPVALAMNHLLVLVGAIACAWGLVRRGRRADAWVAGGLLFALASAGSGLAVLAAAAIHSALTPASRTRWLAVLVPGALWVAWFAVFLRTFQPHERVVSPAVDRTLELMGEGIRNTFEHLVLGNRVGGVLLGLAFVGHLAWRLGQGWRAPREPADDGAPTRRTGPARAVESIRGRTAPAASALAWTAALALDWYGLTRARGGFLNAEAWRYTTVAAGFVLLALVPPEKVVWPPQLTSRGRLAVAGATLLVGVALGVVVSGDLRRFESDQRVAGASTRSIVTVVNLDSARVPDDYRFGFGMGYYTATQLRRLTDRFGWPDQSDEEADRRLIEDLPVAPVRTDRIAPGTCRGAPTVIEAGAQQARATVMVAARSREATVALRRFGTEWVDVGTIRPGRVYELRLPGLASPVRWQIRGQGLCVVDAD